MDSFISLFQGIMLLLLYLTFIIRSGLLYLKDGINPFVLGKGKRGINAIVEYIFFVGLLVWSYEIAAVVFGLHFHIIPIMKVHQPIIDSSVMKYIGMIISLGGYIIFVLSLAAFGKSWRMGIDKTNPGKLVTNGTFSITRNPIFVYIDLYFIGTALINGNIFFIFFALAVSLGIHYQILQEEKFLNEYYGEEYTEYKNKVRRYF
jgi:protein-S-isoprenylcysteine O-methyltransferase Ste14